MSKKLSKSEYAQKMKDVRKKLFDSIDEHALDIIRDQEEYISFLELYSRLNYTVINTLREKRTISYYAGNNNCLLQHRFHDSQHL